MIEVGAFEVGMQFQPDSSRPTVLLREQPPDLVEDGRQMAVTESRQSPVDRMHLRYPSRTQGRN